MVQSKKRQRLWRAERLEPRDLLAGNVQAQLIDGTLFVRGDELSNRVEIMGTGVAGQALVRPSDYISPTTVNGQEWQLFDGVTRDIVIALLEGEDYFMSGNLDVAGRLIIDMGSGTDSILLGYYGQTAPRPGGTLAPRSLLVRGDLQVGLGLPGEPSPDYINLHNVIVAGATHLALGDGANRVDVWESSLGPISIATGSHSDRVEITDSRLGGLNVDQGGADDSLWCWRTLTGTISVAAGAGDDTISLVDCVLSADAYLELGDGNDDLYIKTSTATGTLSTGLGQGDDRAWLEIASVKSLRLDTGEGADLLLVRQSAFDNFWASLGAGNDTASLSGSIVRNNGGRLAGGGGTDGWWYDMSAVSGVQRTEFEQQNSAPTAGFTLRAHLGSLTTSAGAQVTAGAGFTEHFDTPLLIVVPGKSVYLAEYWEDSNSDGVVDERDLMVFSYLHQDVLIPGDCNADGQVDVLDYVVIDNHFGKTGGKLGPFSGDLNLDQVVDLADMLIVDNNFGRSSA